MDRNPAFKELTFEGPTFVKPKTERKLKPEDLLPTRVFEQWGKQKCRFCNQEVDVVFALAKTRAQADDLFDRKRGISAICMMRVLMSWDIRINTLDGGRPNPSATMEAATAIARFSTSPYQIWSFIEDKKRPCGCNKLRNIYFVIAAGKEEAEKRLKQYGQCSVCMCETLCIDRYIIETTTGRVL